MLSKSFTRRRVLLTAIGVTLLSGCTSISSTFSETTDRVKAKMQLADKEIAAPEGKLRLFDTSEDEQDTALAEGTSSAVKSLFKSLDEPLSLTAPVVVSTLTSLNPEIINTNRFGSLTAARISAALVADGYTVDKKNNSKAAPKSRSVLTGTYSRAGSTLTITLQLTDMYSNQALGEVEYEVPINGYIRQMLDS